MTKLTNENISVYKLTQLSQRFLSSTAKTVKLDTRQTLKLKLIPIYHWVQTFSMRIPCLQENTLLAREYLVSRQAIQKINQNKVNACINFWVILIFF
jgi:hypothetical protein